MLWTFLSWCRTGISLIAFGFVIERFDILIRELQIFSTRAELAGQMRGTRHLGLTAFLLGTLIIVMAGWRFFYLRRNINRGETDFSILSDVIPMGSVLVTVFAILLFFVFLF